jgi:hypothetical protein
MSFRVAAHSLSDKLPWRLRIVSRGNLKTVTNLECGDNTFSLVFIIKDRSDTHRKYASSLVAMPSRDMLGVLGFLMVEMLLKCKWASNGANNSV